MLTLADRAEAIPVALMHSSCFKRPQRTTDPSFASLTSENHNFIIEIRTISNTGDLHNMLILVPKVIDLGPQYAYNML